MEEEEEEEVAEGDHCDYSERDVTKSKSTVSFVVIVALLHIETG